MLNDDEKIVIVSSIVSSYVLTYFVKVYLNEEWSWKEFVDYVDASSSVVPSDAIKNILILYFSVSNTHNLMSKLKNDLTAFISSLDEDR